MDTDTTGTPEEDLRERALELLEFPQVMERLAGHTQTPLGSELALNLRPAHAYDDVQLRQQETSEAVLLLERGREVEFSTARDVRRAVESAALGATLPGPDLRDVAGTARALGSARSVVGSQSDLGILSHLARQIVDFRDIERQLSRSIGREGEVLDGASRQLAELRVRARETFGTLESSLQRMMRSLYARGVLQEPIITQRQGRMVILVKAEMRQHVQGIVHDVSDSGATLFVEPLPAISQGNQWQELRLAAIREEERVLRDLSALVGDAKDDLLLGMDVLARIDLAMAKARYSAAVRATPVSLVQGEKPYILLSEARHPLLTGQVVPNTIQLGDGSSDNPCHRAERGRQDRVVEDGRPADGDGPGRPSRACQRGHRQRLRRLLRRHRRPAEHRALHVHVQLSRPEPGHDLRLRHAALPRAHR